jgi:predicted nucleic acid-binding protein
MQNDSESMVLDTSFISSLYKIDDALHDRAVEIYSKQVSGSEIFVPVTVILELSLLHEAYTKYINFQKYLNALNFSIYYLDIFFEAELQTFLKKEIYSNKSKLKPMDLSVLLCALSNKSRLITFDKKLLKVWEKLRTSYHND